jgi:hypothetical protein
MVQGACVRSIGLMAMLGLLPACDFKLDNITNPCGEAGCPTPPPQDCATLSAMTSWSIGRPSYVWNLTVGQSVLATVQPTVEAQCAGRIVSLTWSVDDPSVASVVGQGTPYQMRAWLTGAGTGTTRVRARIEFNDGVHQDAQPGPVRVTPAAGPPAGTTLAARGKVDVPAPPSSPGAARAFVPFSLGAKGRVDVIVDWVSPLDVVDFSAYEGACSTVPCPGMIVIASMTYNVKPASGYNILDAGDYTIRLDNLGPGPETVRYEVRLTPR